MNTSRRIQRVSMSAIIAAMYIVLTIVSASVGLSSGAIQFRLSEALCILPAFTLSAIPGLFVGCFLSNLIAGGVLFDMIFGAFATLIGALGTYAFRKNRWIAGLCPVIANMVIVPIILIKEYGVPVKYPILMLSVGLGEFVCAFILGELLYSAIKRRRLDHQMIK